MEASPRGIVDPMHDFQTVYHGVPVTLSEVNFPNQNPISQEQMVDNGNWFGSYEPGIGVNQDFSEANAGMGYHFQADSLQNSTFQDLLELVSTGSIASSSNANVDYPSGVTQEQMVDNAGMGYHFQADALQNSGFQDLLKFTSAGSNCSNGLSFDFDLVNGAIPNVPITPDEATRAYKEQAFNLVPGEIPNVPSSGSISTPFAPITPDEATRSYKEQVFNAADIELNVQLPKNDGNIDLNVVLNENHAPDKGSDQGSELINTPQQKPKKKKHRPKVVKEGQPKRTPKPKTPKVVKEGQPKKPPKPAGEGSTPKRKYVRRENKIDNPDPLQTPPGLMENSFCKRKYVRRKLNDPDSAPLEDGMISRQTGYSCKKSLNFESENLQINESMPSKDQLNLNEELQPPVDLSQMSTIGHQTECSGRSNWSNDTCRIQEPSAGFLSPNTSGVTYNSLSSYASVLSPNGMNINEALNLLFPVINKKKRTMKWNMAEASKENRLTPASITWVPPTQCDASWNPRYSVANYAAMNENPIPDSNLGLGENPEAKTKRSRGPTQRRSLQLVHQEVVSEFPSIKKTKKRSKRDSTASSSRPPLAITWKPVSLIDEIIDRFSVLSLNTEGTRFLYHNQYDALQMSNPDQNALVPYQRDLTIVPVRKRKQRAKVDLDPETARVWTLLLENIRSEGIDGTDEEKTKWWKEERSVFCGRAESFIARMHLIQGDRRFTPWKGSVVDSVVGVFLTQNVSDHLSSSAYMSLAARYPPKSSNIPGESVGEETSIITRELEVHISEPDDMDDTCHEKSEVDDIVSSQNSVNYSIDQSGKCVLNSPCTSEEDSTKSGQNLFPSPPSFLELLHTVEGNTENRDGSVSSQNSFDIDPENSGLSAGSANQTTVERTRFSSEDENSSTTRTAEVTNLPDLNQKASHSSINAYCEQLDNGSTPKEKGKELGKQNEDVDWDALRRDVQTDSVKKERRADRMDSVDWERIRCADVAEIADTIRARGMNNRLAQRIKDFLDRIVEDHGSIDLEWLRDVLPDKAKEYLLSIKGLGLKSVECVRLLTLHHLAFPVDVNVGRIAVRLGWVPLQPLPESLQLHLLEMYPILESIQQYLWPRLCKLDQRTLYELHYQMITFGKVFCTKSRPNCNACPMRGECRHFASAFASARLALPAPETNGILATVPEQVVDQHSAGVRSLEKLCLPGTSTQPGDEVQSSVGSGSCTSTDLCLSQCNKQFGENSETSTSNPIVHVPATPEPNVEEPPSPEPEPDQYVEPDMEDFEDPDEIPTIRLNMEQFAQNLKNLVSGNMELQEHEMSKALVAITAEAASLPTPKLKNINMLRTEHRVYELPDSHPLLEGFERRERDDPSPYLLAIWTPGETADSIELPEKSCKSRETGVLCDVKTCFSCNSVREESSKIVRGTILIPCRTAMRGSFPLNGTYFQVNEMLADHASSLEPISVPRGWIWNLPRRTVYFGTSVTSIFKGLNTDEIQFCFWRGFVCVRGFEQSSRAPKPLIARLHFPASKRKQATT